MGTITAQIIVGKPDLYHGGINPTHFLFLSENDRPTWILVEENISAGQGKPRQPRVVWIPTVEGILEDAFLMIGLHIIKDKELIKEAKPLFKNKPLIKISLDKDIDKADLILLHNRNKEVIAKFNAKMIISSFHGSSILKHLRLVKEYQMDNEVCVPKYRRSTSWENEVIIEGELD